MPGDVPDAVRSFDLLVRQEGLAPRPLKALVADDDDDFREMLCGLLEQLGLDVVGARHGHEAMALILDVLPDVVFMDHRMPGISGGEVARSLRLTGPRSCVVIVTGSPDAAEIAAKAGTPHYLTKPVSLAELKEMLVRATRPSD